MENNLRIELYYISEINNGVSLLSFDSKTSRDNFFNALTPIKVIELRTNLQDSDSFNLEYKYNEI